MDILYMRCAGLDIHRDTIVACVRLAEAGGVVRLVETFALRRHHRGVGAAV